MKQYEKPRLDKRAVLQAVTAQILSEAASPPDNNEDGGDEAGVIT